MRRFGRSLAEVAEPIDGPWAARLAEIAERHGVVVVAGMFSPADGGRVTNTLRVVGPGVDAHYDKIHLFDAFGFTESDTVAPGTEPLVLRLGDLGVGFATCYDLRFPGLFTTLAERGAQLICVPASWGAGPGKVDAVAAADPGAGAGLHQLSRGRRPSGSGDRRPTDWVGPHRGRVQRGGRPGRHCYGLPRARAGAAAGRHRP